MSTCLRGVYRSSATNIACVCDRFPVCLNPYFDKLCGDESGLWPPKATRHVVFVVNWQVIVGPEQSGEAGRTILQVAIVDGLVLRKNVVRPGITSGGKRHRNPQTPSRLLFPLRAHAPANFTFFCVREQRQGR